MLNRLKKAEIQNEDYIPQKVIDREKEKEMLMEWKKNNFLRNLLITSPESGTGKTVTVKWFFENKINEDKIKPIHILCDDKTNYNLAKDIAEGIEYKTGIMIQKKRSKADLMNYIRGVFKYGDFQIILCLDEIDYIVNNYNDDTLSSLLHIQRETGGNLYLILISNDYSLKDKLQTKVRSRLNEISITFSKYYAGQGANILEYYIYEEDLIKKKYRNPSEVVKPKLIKFMKKIATGDMRRVLQYFIVWAEMCKDKNKLDLDLLNEDFFNKIMKNEIIDLVEALTQEEKVILLSLIKSKIDERDFRDNKGGEMRKYRKELYHTDFNRLKKYYNYITSKIGMDSVKERRLRHYCYQLTDQKKLVMVEKKSYGRGKGMKGLYHLSDKLEDYFNEVVRILTRDLDVEMDWVYNLRLDKKILV